MEVLAIIGIASVAAFIISVFGFLIYIIYQMGKMTQVINNIPEDIRRELDSHSSAVRKR